MSCTNWNYEDVVRFLMSLPSNKSLKAQLARNRIHGKLENNHVEEVKHFLERIGIPLSRLDELPVIHVAGTKGKGSTSAMCESILRQHGLRTGLCTSPHLVLHRERIRLNGRTLSEEKFVEHARRVYSLLLDTQNGAAIAMPSLFPFLIIMAFHVFLEERVDVAIVEVGLGGTHDSTNVLRKVPVVGITSLGLEHTEELGDSLAEIAAAKAGIMKRGCQVYSAPQPAEAMDVLKERAKRLNCSLSVVPELSSYTFPSEGPRLPVDLPTYRTNASLAIQLAHAWLRLARGHITPQIELEIPHETAAGIRQFHWPGRYQVVDRDYAKFYLDVAHTKESMEICAQWFLDTCDRSTDKILMYSCTPDREVSTQFQYLLKLPFKQVYFVSPNIHKGTLSQEDQKEYRQQHAYYTQLWEDSDSSAEVIVLECLDDVFNCLKKLNEKPSVLVTGHFHMVGVTLSIIGPESAIA